MIEAVPSLFGSHPQTPAGWAARRSEIRAWIEDVLYGAVPSIGQPVEVEHLGWLWSRIHIHEWPLSSFLVRCQLPAGEGPFPCMIFGDLCWENLAPQAEQSFLSRGIGILAFNRQELAPDLNQLGSRGLRREMADKGLPVPGAIAAWAWGVSRVADVAASLQGVDPSRLGVMGHSRGGKTALLAAALDDRISVVCDNQSGCMGSASLVHVAEGGEHLADITRNFPFWFHPDLARHAGSEAEMGFDAHCFMAMVAPRHLLFTGSEDDLWSNPPGVRLAQSLAAPAWSVQGAANFPQSVWRSGEHGHWPQDFEVQAEFAARAWGL